jgi:citrate synthase
LSSRNHEGASWRTAVSELSGDFATLRGYAVDELASVCDFTEATYLAFTGELPTAAQRTMLNRILVIAVAHGVAPTGALTRSIIACGSPMQAALAAATLANGDVHGGAGEAFGQLLQEEILVRASETSVDMAAAWGIKFFVEQGKRVPGFGHQWHKDGDPRAGFLLDEARKLEVAGTGCSILTTMASLLTQRLGREIKPNIDGAIAAILTDLDIDWRFSRPVLILARLPTLAALAIEEAKTPSRQWRQLMVSGETYVGPPKRPVVRP